MTHPHEATLIANEAYQNAVAGGIVDAILKYRFAVGAKTPAKPGN
jgi:N-acetylmuramoyl-L-alanine amidase